MSDTDLDRVEQALQALERLVNQPYSGGLQDFMQRAAVRTRELRGALDAYRSSQQKAPVSREDFEARVVVVFDALREVDGSLAAAADDSHAALEYIARHVVAALEAKQDAGDEGA